MKPEQITIVAPDDANAAILAKYGVHKLTSLLTADNYRAVLTPLLATRAGRAFCVNLSVDTSSVAIMALARELGALYIDTVIEPWPGFITRVRAAPASIIVNLIPVFGLASAVLWLGDPLTAARVLGAILIGLSVTIFTATELADAGNAAKANVTPSKA